MIFKACPGNPPALSLLTLAALLWTSVALAVPMPERNPAAIAGGSDAAMPLPGRKAPTLAAEPGRHPPLPLRKPDRAPEAAPQPSHPSEIEAEAWSDKDIAEAARACVELLKDAHVTFDLLPPLREGACGTPAPIDVTAIGDDPAVRLVPAATMTCPLAAALATWVRETMQPAARNHLAAPVTQMRNASAYVCRTRYDAPDRPISEHARANALDISVFETAQGDTVSVLDHWNAVAPSPPPVPERAPERSPFLAVSLDSGADATDDTDAAHDAPVEPEQEAASTPPKRDPRALFLRGVHRAACDRFGTVLGPEANRAHADHFHFDMAARRHGNYCR